MKTIDPKQFGLSSRTEIIQTGEGEYAIIKKRASRIIMKDGEAILRDVGKILQKHHDATVHLRTNAPVCSKTRAFLLDNGIEVHSIQD